MLNAIIRFALKNRMPVLAAAILLSAYGLYTVAGMPVDVFPEFAPPMVEIQTPSLGLSAEEVEELVTIPLEQELAGVEGLDVMRSKSVPDLSQIKMIFKPGFPNGQSNGKNSPFRRLMWMSVSAKSYMNTKNPSHTSCWNKSIRQPGCKKSLFCFH